MESSRSNGYKQALELYVRSIGMIFRKRTQELMSDLKDAMRDLLNCEKPAFRTASHSGVAAMVAVLLLTPPVHAQREPSEGDGQPLAQKTEQQEKKRSDKDLETGSILTIYAKDLPISEILGEIERATGNRIRCVHRTFRTRDDTDLLGNRISVDLEDVTFWQAIKAVQSATSDGLYVKEISDHTVQLGKGGVGRFGYKPAGESVSIGAFQVIPVKPPNSNYISIRIRPEPWIRVQTGLPILRDSSASLTLPKGQVLQYKGLVANSNVPPARVGRIASGGELEMTLIPPADATKATKLDLAVTMFIPFNEETITLGPVGSLAGKTILNRENLRVTLTKAEMDIHPQKPSQPAFVVGMHLEGELARLGWQAIGLHPGQVSLVDNNGTRLKSSVYSWRGHSGEFWFDHDSFNGAQYHIRMEEFPTTWTEYTLEATLHDISFK